MTSHKGAEEDAMLIQESTVVISRIHQWLNRGMLPNIGQERQNELDSGLSPE